MLRTAITFATALVLAGVVATPAAIALESPHDAEFAPEFRLKGDVVSIPFVMVREFPFVEATINGVRGKLLLDTGALEALSLNHNRLKLPEGRVIGRGNFASGQTYEMILRPSVEKVSLAGGLTYHHITNLSSQDATQLEHITPDFLGWMGHGFWAGYAAKFDYKASRATFYKGGPKAFLKGEMMVAVIPFQTRNRPNIPVLMAMIGDTAFETVLDTGQYGNIYADTATLEHLSAIGALSPAQDSECDVDVKTVQFSEGPAITMAKLGRHPIEEATPFAKGIGVTSSRILSLGYVFLKQYKTVWDYPDGTLYLLKP
jgi:hypothetical protein